MVISLPKIGWSFRFATGHIFTFNTKDNLSNRNLQWNKNLETYRKYRYKFTGFRQPGGTGL